MEANKDSAFHYIELAEGAILANENERALRYLNKSESLFPTEKAKGLSLVCRPRQRSCLLSPLSDLLLVLVRSHQTIDEGQFPFERFVLDAREETRRVAISV